MKPGSAVQGCRLLEGNLHILDKSRLVLELIPYYVDRTFETRVDIRRFKLRFIYAGEILEVLNDLLDSVCALKGFVDKVIEVSGYVIDL